MLAKYSALALALLFALVSLGLRSTIPHDFVTLYTGDNGEELSIAAARNFERFGFAALRFLPVHQPLDASPALAKPAFYTHAPPLPVLLISAAFTAGGGSILAARLLVVLVTLLGLIFATRAGEVFLSGLGFGDPLAIRRVRVVLPLMLATSAGVLCYGDALSEVPFEEVVQWLLLWQCASFLGSPRREGAWALAALGALQVWTGLDWTLPAIGALAYCLWRAPYEDGRRRSDALLIGAVGVLLPLALRLAQNAWAFDGLAPAIQDLLGRARFRMVGDAAYPYSALTHLARAGVATLWLSGPSVPLLILLSWQRSRLSVLVSGSRLKGLFVLWGVGSVSFQFLMPQAAMYHAYTCLHPANFLIFWAALVAVDLWPRRPSAIAALLALQLFWGGALFTTEIGIPFLKGSAQQLASRLCEDDRQALAARLPDMSSSVSRMLVEPLNRQDGDRECGFESRTAKRILLGYLHLIRNSSLD